jgi:hypothetical protein
MYLTLFWLLKLYNKLNLFGDYTNAGSAEKNIWVRGESVKRVLNKSSALAEQKRYLQ